MAYLAGFLHGKRKDLVENAFKILELLAEKGPKSVEEITEENPTQECKGGYCGRLCREFAGAACTSSENGYGLCCCSEGIRE
jgi:hypothetical protein